MQNPTYDPAANPDWWERAVAGQCSHGGHGWDGETCSDAPAACAECGGPVDGTETAYDEMTGRDVPVCDECAPMLALAGNVDPNQPGHGDMARCTVQAPCGDSGCDRCVPAEPCGLDECDCADYGKRSPR
jgi:hypothetical protein